MVDDVRAYRIKAGGGFIIKNALTATDDGTGDASALSHAAGKIHWQLFHVVLEIHNLQRLAHTLLDFVFVLHPGFDQREGDVVLYSHAVKERRVLEKHAYLLPDGSHLALAQAVDLDAIDEDVAFIWADEANDVFHHDGLAFAAGANDDERLTMIKAEVDAAQDLLFAKALQTPRSSMKGCSVSLVVRVSEEAVCIRCRSRAGKRS